MSKIELRKFSDTDDTYKLIYKWCSEKNVYEWFEQRVLSYNEIVKKYKRKLLEGLQKLYIINYDDKPIGLVQLYKYDDFIFDEIKDYKNIYEFDIFIGDADYLSKGLGVRIIKIVNNLIYEHFLADCIILRPFKRNIRAIKCYQKINYKIIKEYDGYDSLGNAETIVILINVSNNK